MSGVIIHTAERLNDIAEQARAAMQARSTPPNRRTMDEALLRVDGSLDYFQLQEARKRMRALAKAGNS